jgi:hypothetical protein
MRMLIYDYYSLFAYQVMGFEFLLGYILNNFKNSFGMFRILVNLLYIYLKIDIRIRIL